MASKKKTTKTKPRTGRHPSKKKTTPVLAKYEPTIRSQIEKREAFTKFGITMAETGHIMYIWDGGWFKWMPYKLLRKLVHMWNSVVCMIGDHDTFGPIVDEDGTILSPKTCMHCSMIWKTP